jgi:hypothetical protein
MRYAAILLLLVLTGCKTTTEKPLPPLPQPATTQGLTTAEKELDKATEDRLSKVSAGVGISYLLAQKNPQSLNNDVLLAELKLAKTLTGRAVETDWVTVKKRVETALGGGDLGKLYEKEQAEAAALRSKLKEADAKYEAEKAKKQAEFDAKLLEREQEIKREQEMRRLEKEEARKDKFMWLGGLICLAGALMFVFASKQDGIEAFVAGVAIASIGQIWDSPYFPWAIGVMLLLAVVRVGFFLFKKRKGCDRLTDVQEGESSSDSTHD